MGKYSLNLRKNGRILSVCNCIEGQTYEKNTEDQHNELIELLKKGTK